MNGITLIVTVILQTVKCFDLDLSVYAGCFINVIDSDSGVHRISTDFISEIVTNNLGYQRWTLATIKYNRSTPEMWLEDTMSQFLWETCSINILVEIQGCYYRDLDHLFGSRIHNPDSVLLLLYGQSLAAQGCLERLRSTEGARPILSKTLWLQISEDVLSVESFHCFCSTCETLTSRYEQMITWDGLDSSMSECKLRRNSVQTKLIVAVYRESISTTADLCKRKLGFLYRERPSTDIVKICGYDRYVQIENIAFKLNMTVQYEGIERVTQNMLYLINSPPQFGAVATLEVYEWEVVKYPNVITANLYTQLLVGKEVFKFLYCQRGDQKQAFSLVFWSVPLDRWTWTLLGTSSLVLCICLGIDWLEIWRVLMRQSSKVVSLHNKLLLLFMLTAIVFTYGYEGVVSSLLMAPPPPKIFRTLRHILQNDYKLIPPYNKAAFLEDLSRVNNISMTSLQSSILNINKILTSSEVQIHLGNGNVTVSTEIARISEWAMETELHFMVHCYWAPGTSWYRNRVDTFSGPLHRELATAMKQMAETGIQNMYVEYFLFAFTIKHHQRQEKRDQKLAQPKPLKMNSKIQSMFNAWASLLGGGAIIVLAELIIHKLHTNLRKTQECRNTG